MKNVFLAGALALLLSPAFAQENSDGKSGIPVVNIKGLDGAVVSTSTLVNDGKPIIISFWATWCKPCVNELNTLNELYADWQKETGVKIYAISIDDARTTASVAPFINGKGWEFDVFLDPNGDFKRAMNVNMVPHVFLLNGNREVVHQHTSYSPGDEDKLLELVQQVAEGQPIH
ncbi:MAG TPA: TlpA disulfide reductase family protein [Bacteroidia bacterium]|nr:TlpA disulfide reductase family protein [Bacteroidia bacterium]